MKQYKIRRLSDGRFFDGTTWRQKWTTGGKIFKTLNGVMETAAEVFNPDEIEIVEYMTTETQILKPRH